MLVVWHPCTKEIPNLYTSECGGWGGGGEGGNIKYKVFPNFFKTRKQKREHITVVFHFKSSPLANFE